MLSKEVKFLEDAHAILNEQFFESKLSKAVITVQSSPKFYGHCSRAKVWEDGSGVYYEINLAAEYLNRPLVDTIATLVHEMVHQWCNENGIQDCSRSGNYHNQKYKEAAEAHGLNVAKDPKKGWTLTTPTEELETFIHKKWKREIELHRNTAKNERAKRSSSTRKYTCPCCGQSVRATKDVHIMCMDCEQEMEEDN